VSRDVVPGYNDQWAPFPRACFHKAFSPLCWQRVLNMPEVRLSGGLLMAHADTFFDPQLLFAPRDADDRMEHVLMPRQVPNADARKNDGPKTRRFANVSSTWAQSWAAANTGTTRPQVDQRNRAAARIAAFAPEWLSEHERADACYRMATRRKDTDSQATEEGDGRVDISEVRGFLGGVVPLVLNQGDLFYVPDRAFDLAADLLDGMLPTPTTSEPTAGWLAEMTYRATGGNRSLAVTPDNHRWRAKVATGHERPSRQRVSPTARTVGDDAPLEAERLLGASCAAPEEAPDVVRWHHVAYAGGCCSQVEVPDIATLEWAAGHKVRLKQKAAVDAMRVRLRSCFFGCKRTLSTSLSVAPPSRGQPSTPSTASSASRRFAAVFPHAWRGGGAVALFHTPTTCSVVVEALISAARSIVVAPNTLHCTVTLAPQAEELVLHTPSVHSARIVFKSPASATPIETETRIVLRTGVMQPANVTMERLGAPAGGTSVKRFAARTSVDMHHDAFEIVCVSAPSTSRVAQAPNAAPTAVLITIADHRDIRVVVPHALECAFAL